MTKRECGSCSLCCKVMGVPEVKAEHTWCPHAKPGAGGCTIYRNRPELCREFHCMWLIDEKIPDYWYPAKSKIVINPKLDGKDAYVAFVVDPSYPNRWREQPWLEDIKLIAQIGLSGRLGVKWRTVISVRGEQIPVVLEPPIKRAVTPASDFKGEATA
jgi:hypothetical protein